MTICRQWSHHRGEYVHLHLKHMYVCACVCDPGTERASGTYWKINRALCVLVVWGVLVQTSFIWWFQWLIYLYHSGFFHWNSYSNSRVIAWILHWEYGRYWRVTIIYMYKSQQNIKMLIGSALDQIMACRLFGAKPLSKHSQKWIWKYRLRNGGHFVQGEMS